jgi:hypothetical protein
MLVHMKLLKSEMRNDANAIIEALFAHLDRTLDLMPDAQLQMLNFQICCQFYGLCTSFSMLKTR